MFKCFFLLLITLYCLLADAHARRRNPTSSQHHLGDFCIPGTCTSLNSNCKRVGGSAFRCVCKEQYMSVNKTHCVRVINTSMDSSCAPCIARGGVCLDEDSDDHMDRCFCQTESDLCHGRTTSSPIPATQPIRKIVPIATAAIPSRPLKQGDLQLGLYDINQQRLIDNGGSAFIGDRLFIEIKYRSAEPVTDQHQIIAENCTIASSVSDYDPKSEKISLLTNRCPSLDSRFSIRFQRIDPDHVKSSVFQIQKFETTSVVYLRCSIAICYGRIENCQERLCPEIRQASGSRRPHPTIHNGTVGSAVDTGPFDYVDEDGASVIALRRRKRRIRYDHDEEHQTKKQLARLISDLTSSVDKTETNHQLEMKHQSNGEHFEIRQVQQQFTIESPLPQPTKKHKTAHEAIYGRTSLGTQGAVERSTVIAAISIIFIIGISVSLFVVYRTCYIEYAQRIYGSASFAGFGPSGESVYGGVRSTSQVCRYDMGRRSEQRFDESFFVSNVEPLGAYRRQY